MSNISRDDVVDLFKKELKLNNNYNELLSKSIYKLKLNTGEKLHDFNEFIPGIFFISKGTMRSIYITKEKEILSLKKYKENEIVGKFQFFNLLENFSITASTPTEGYILPKEDLIKIIKEDENVLKKSFNELSLEELFFLISESLKFKKINPYDIRKLAEDNINNVKQIKFISTENIKDFKFYKNKWILVSNNIENIFPGEILDSSKVKRLSGNRPLKMIQFIGSWPLLKDKEKVLNKFNEEKKLNFNESYENWYGPIDNKKFPHTKAKGNVQIIMACLRMLSINFELPFRKDILKKIVVEQTKNSKEGFLSINKLSAILNLLSIKTTKIRLFKLYDLKEISTPSVLLVNNLPIIIWKRNNNKILIGDPSSNQEWCKIDKFYKNYVKDGDDILYLEKKLFSPKSRFNLKWFLPAIIKHKNKLALVVISSFFIQLLALFNPLLIQQIIDAVISQGNFSSLNILGLLLIFMALSQAVMSALRTFLFADTTNRIDLSLGGIIINHLYRLPMNFFSKRSVGEVNSRVTELEKIREFLTGTALTAILDAAFSLIYIFVMLLYSVTLTFCSLAVIPFFILLTTIVSPILRDQYRQYAKDRAFVSSHLVESINGIETIKGQGVETFSEWRWENLYNKQINSGFKNTITNTSASSISGFLQQISGLIVIWVGALLVLKGELTLGGLIAFRILSSYVTTPILRLTSLWQNFQETLISLERLSDVINNPKEEEIMDTDLPPFTIEKGNIEYKKVSFSFYDDNQLQIRNINLKINAGDFIGIIGKSGSGKSTILKLLSRFYPINSGKIEIDGYDISKINLYSLRYQIGLVSQDSLLFDGTLKENISLSRPDASLDEVISAAKIACADEFIQDLPLSYNTNVGEKGSMLSGGQRQRISIARMILSDPKIIILDEATSALDFDTETRLLKNLIAKYKNTTILFITHRINSLINADKIFLIHNGLIDEQGNHQELLKMNGRYKNLISEQRI